MSNTLKISVLLAAAVILVGGFFVFIQKEAAEPVPVPPAPVVTVVDEHLTIDETLRDVNFCGKTYKVKQVLIDGVDVVQRVAFLSTRPTNPILKRFSEDLCGTVKFNPQDELLVEGVAPIISDTSKVYAVSTQIFQVIIDAKTNDINIFDGYTGGPIGSIGTLK